MKKHTWLSIFIVLLIFSASVLSQTQERTFLPLDVDVPFPPSPVKCEGKTHFLYELHITNFGPSDVTLQGVEVFGKGNPNQSLGMFEGKSLEDLLTHPGTIPNPKNPMDKKVISGGKRAHVTLWLTIESDKTVPSHLIHHLSVQYASGLLSAPDGEKELKEQVLAELGNTGNSGGPHLHFHVVDQNMILAAEGVPYVFESFEIVRKLEGNDVGELYMKLASWKLDENPEPNKRRMETPLNFYVLRFPETVENQ